MYIIITNFYIPYFPNKCLNVMLLEFDKYYMISFTNEYRRVKGWEWCEDDWFMGKGFGIKIKRWRR